MFALVVFLVIVIIFIGVGLFQRKRKKSGEAVVSKDLLSSQNIIRELGLGDLPEEKQAELLTNMTESVLKRITIKILERLSKKDINKFEQLQETGDPKIMEEFLRSKISGYDQMLAETINEYKEEIKATTADLRTGLEEDLKK